MQDAELLALYQARDEHAIRETDAKYGSRLRQIAEELLADRQDAEEIVSDVLMQAWGKIPEEPPVHLFAYLAAVTRNLSMNRLDARNAKRRGGGKLPAVLDELSECIADSSSVEQAVSERLLDDALCRFLDSLTAEQRTTFVLRYYYAMPLPEIAARKQVSVSTVKVTLMRLRKKLRQYLELEGLL
jgi:RNA polymerase sigma-70 factor (ECF subfamily)